MIKWHTTFSGKKKRYVCSSFQWISYLVDMSSPLAAFLTRKRATQTNTRQLGAPIKKIMLTGECSHTVYERTWTPNHPQIIIDRKKGHPQIFPMIKNFFNFLVFHQSRSKFEAESISWWCRPDSWPEVYEGLHPTPENYISFSLHAFFHTILKVMQVLFPDMFSELVWGKYALASSFNQRKLFFLYMFSELFWEFS